VDTIKLAKQNNERIVKCYKCTEWKRPKLEGFLTVTTERVIFAGASKRTKTNLATGAIVTEFPDRIVEEAELKSVSGLSSFYGTKLNILALLAGLVLIFGGLMGFISACEALSKGNWLPAEVIVFSIFGMIFAVACVIFGGIILKKWLFSKAFFLNIYSSQSAGTPISIGNTKTANAVVLSLAGLPTAETDTMMLELGALIADLKTDKEEAYKAWKL
jgi:hypothetical protein